MFRVFLLFVVILLNLNRMQCNAENTTVIPIESINSSSSTKTPSTEKTGLLGEMCYICRYNSHELAVDGYNDKTCLSENPIIRLPCPTDTCAIWTFRIESARNIEISAKVCVTDKLFKCYEQLTGTKLVKGKCASQTKISKEKLKLLLSGECGDIKIPKLKGSDDNQRSGDDYEDYETGTVGNERSWGSGLSERIEKIGKKVDEIFKFETKYEVCVCDGNLCNDYKKLRTATVEDEKKDNKSASSVPLVNLKIVPSSFMLLVIYQQRHL